MSRNELVDVDVEVLRETDAALLVLGPEGDEVWVPRSQIDDSSEVSEPGDSGVLVIPRWLAEAKGLA